MIKSLFLSANTKIPGYIESDYGRKHGWNILVQGKIVGELSYSQYIENSQFWHEYKISLVNLKFEGFKTNPNSWHEAETSLQNKYATHYSTSEYLPGGTRRKGIISMRNLVVPP